VIEAKGGSMSNVRWFAGRVLVVVAGVLGGAGWALGQTTVNISYLEGQVPPSPDTVATYGADMFGDKASLYGGSLEFNHVGLQLPGNNRLEVALRRRHTAGRDSYVRGQLGDWDLDTPRIGSSYASGIGWVTLFGGTNRCSTFGEPPPHSSGVDARDYWQGVQLNVPGQGTQEVLARSSAYSKAPTDGGTYPLLTHQNWQVSCLSTLQNGAGEGFVAVSPDGVRYRFDWMATRAQTSVRSRVKSGGTARLDIYLMATEVTDRHGNWVRYTYDPANPINLLRIESSDGRLITVTYAGGKVASASDGTRTYTYSYDAFGDLQFVTQPDGSRWTFNLRGMVAQKMPNVGDGATCDSIGDTPVDGDVQPGVITHPSGATGTFNTQFRTLGISYAPRQCITPLSTPTRTVGSYWPRAASSQVLLSKSISGPGMPTETWTYEYAGQGSWNTCTSNCGGTRTVTVTQPDGSVTRHVFGNRWHVNEGQLQRTDEGWDGVNALRSTVYHYRDPAGQNFPDQFGSSVYNRSDWLSSRHRPQDQVVVTQQGINFTWQADGGSAGFDALARPVLVTKSSSLGFGKTETTA
jgi:YD repeat-containing protein